MTTTDLSIIIPAKDGAPYLSTMFRSLLAQGPIWDHTQLIFIDDGSSDDTPAVLETFASEFPRFDVLTNPEASGLANARNQGLGAAEGEHIVFLDGDDWLAPGHLPVMLEEMHRLGVDFIRCDHTTVQGTKRVRKLAPMSVRGVALDPRVGITPVHDSTMVDYPYAWAGIFHRRLLERGILTFPENFMTAEDRSWIWRLHLRAESFAVVDAPGILYRRGLANSLTQILDERQLDFIRAFGQIFDLIGRDAHAEEYWPKAIRNWLAILDHQITRFSASPVSLRMQLRRGAAAVSAQIPRDLLREEFAHQKPSRQLNVSSYLGDSRAFILEMVK
ncbi:glycosyltransferase involved in cell wall biosynthesis [Brevibacterium sanguinis]|uniref:Glycosyltransferase involved in cell wall biosynthesis n=2 Tax=Brevibacterium TaxID=1696 RepID=A0A366INC7_9MICO|nr:MULTISPECIES: glycosyltransferase family 2 protein [Brevibacterium]RBP68234.1 glycosyltransferase involved in cell wall biosynthesis [Brevibacterium sanguinis]RBP74349.1 glycosyltransferase involved in cell wall biosynthesis [Brevibacterium celere]